LLTELIKKRHLNVDGAFLFVYLGAVENPSKNHRVVGYFELLGLC